MASFHERRAQLLALDPSDFEALAHRVVRASYPAAESTGNPDSGADTLLPRPGLPGWERAWQARRYAAGPKLKNCEEALDLAVAEWKVTHYTFIFVADLTGPQMKRFNTRLRTRHEGVTVDCWGLAELLARLDETPDGRRVAHHFLGETKEEVDQKWRDAMALGGNELKGANDLFAKLRAMGRWLGKQEYVGYSHHSWEPWQTEPVVASETFLAFLEIEGKEGRRTRIDAAARPDAPPDQPLAQFRLEFTPDEAGEQAAAAFEEAEAKGESVAFDSGVRVTWEVLPDLLKEYVDQTVEGRVEIHPTRRFPRKWQAELRPSNGDPRSVELVVIEHPEFELAWRGTVAGFGLLVGLRRLERGGETRLDANFTLTTEHSVQEQLRAAQVMQALDQPGHLVINSDDGSEVLSVALNERDAGADEQLAGIADTLANLAVIEEWTGEQLEVPETLPSPEAQDIAFLAHGIRHEAFPVPLLGDILWDDTPETRAGLDQAGVIRFQQSFGFRVLGRELWLGYLDYASRDYEIIESDEHPDKLLVRPKGKDGETLFGRLRRGQPDEPVEAPFERLPGSGRSHRGK